MYKNKKIVALIPARSGSKRLPKKNIKFFIKKPLIYWSIRVAKKSNYIDHVYVTTDDNHIKKISLKYGSKVPFIRSKKNSTDKSPSEEFIIEFLDKVQNKYHYLILLQPTSPLRKKTDIDFSIKTIINKNYSSLVSITNLKKINLNLYKNKKVLNKLIKYLKNKKGLVNGSIYIINIKKFLKNKKIINKKTRYFETSINSSIDIDTKFDFELAKLIKKNGI